MDRRLKEVKERISIKIEQRRRNIKENVLLSWIANEELHSRTIKNLEDDEIDFLDGDIGSYRPSTKELPLEKDYYQQSDLLRGFYLDILEKGLTKVYRDVKNVPDVVSQEQEAKTHGRRRSPRKKTAHPKKVVIVGAGISGLVAAYELLRAGHEVEILEMTQRFGGRIKTFDDKNGFDKGLHVDGGAMRLPSKKDTPEGHFIHYLTDGYISKFNIERVKFFNSDSNALLKFYDSEPVKIKTWNQEIDDPSLTNNFTKYWPGWDDKIKACAKKEECSEHCNIKSIVEYSNKTTGIITDLIKKRLKGVDCRSKQATQWRRWIDNWSQFSFAEFLRSNRKAILTKVKFLQEDKHKVSSDDLKGLDCLLPWPEKAITAYKVFSYTVNLDASLVTFIQEDLGKWWTPEMHSIVGGMSTLPKTFAAQEWNSRTVESRITHNRTVTNIDYVQTKDLPGTRSVTIRGIFTSSGESFTAEGYDAVIVTLPLNIIRQVKISNGENTDPVPKEIQQAIEGIWYSPSTKVMLQYRERFWDQECNKENQIKGGFSKTNLPIGQVHYPTNPSKDAAGGKGILLVYTWKSEALLFGSLPEHVAVRQAVEQINEIHPGTKDLFEVGAVQAWYSDPSSQGAFVLLKPWEYYNVAYLMYHPWRNVYFAGEAISFANGWIQGALESGLRASFEFYSDNEKRYNPK